MHGTLKWLRPLDYMAGIAALLYGLFTQSWVWITFGILGLILTSINLAERIRNLILHRANTKAQARSPVIGYPEPPSTPYRPPAERKQKSSR